MEIDFIGDCRVKDPGYEVAANHPPFSFMRSRQRDKDSFFLKPAPNFIGLDIKILDKDHGKSAKRY